MVRCLLEAPVEESFSIGFVGVRFKVKHCTPLGMLLRAASHFEVEDGAAAEAVGGTG
jgi:hypothetical protein